MSFLKVCAKLAYFSQCTKFNLLSFFLGSISKISYSLTKTPVFQHIEQYFSSFNTETTTYKITIYEYVKHAKA
jgi:hypothetical protein